MLKNFAKLLSLTILFASGIFTILVFSVSQFGDTFSDGIFAYMQSSPDIVGLVYMFIFILCYMVIDMFIPN